MELLDCKEFCAELGEGDKMRSQEMCRRLCYHYGGSQQLDDALTSTDTDVYELCFKGGYCSEEHHKVIRKVMDEPGPED